MPTTRELTVADIMDPVPVAVGPSTPVRDVLAAMNDRRVGSVLVLDGSQNLAGIFTERDLLKRVVSAVPGWRDYPVSEWMTAEPHTIAPGIGWNEAVTRMHKLRIRHFPVVDAGKVVGIVSTRSLMARREEDLRRRVEVSTAKLRAANEHLMTRDAEILTNMRAAGRLQTRALLPQAPPPWPELRWAIHYKPLDHLGGDYYDFATPTDDRLGFLIADASGHSIPAAMVAVMARFAFAEAIARARAPGEVMGLMNRRLADLTDERFVTAFYGVLDRGTREFRYATAGHPYPLHYEAATGKVRPLRGQGFILGVVPEEVYAERAANLAPGDRVCFYTDGVSEARNEIGEMYGTPRLEDGLSRLGGLPAPELLAALLAELKAFCGTTPFNDDLTLIVAEVVAA